MDHSQTANFIWNIADLIRDHFRRGKYPDVILPFTVLRRIDLVLTPTKDKVLQTHTRFEGNLALEALDTQLRRASGFAFYNTSKYDFPRLLHDPDAVYANTINYLNGFSDNMHEVIGNFKFRNTVETLHEANLLYAVVQAFADPKINLHPDAVSNHDMGTIFEELIRRFNEASNENPGEHFTPRDVVRLMVELLLAGDDDFITTPGRVVKVYDPCCGTGGMLTIAKARIEEINSDADVHLYGQEVNPETYAICKSDLLMISQDGRDAENVKQGSTLSDDQHPNQRFNYLITNPPYGKDWRADKQRVESETKLGFGGRFGAGTPRSSDGQLLFLQHMLARRFKPGTGHSRVAIIMNGSPLFTGDAGSGESQIRRWILENDWLEAIIALPESIFYNTGIGTYVWVLSNEKPAHRKGKAQLIDATDFWVPLRKSLGDKRREVGEDDRRRIIDLYLDRSEGEHVKIFDNADFGFRKITVERPLRLNFQASPERIQRLKEQSAFANLAVSKKKDAATKAAEEEAGRQGQETILKVLRGMPATLYEDRAEFLKALRKAARAAGDVKLTKSLSDAILAALGERDETAAICTDKDGSPEPDTELRDTERVPLVEDVDTYFQREVVPHVPDAWISTAKAHCDSLDGKSGKVGYEINFNRYFYTYQPPRPLEEIETDIRALEEEMVAMLREVAG